MPVGAVARIGADMSQRGIFPGGICTEGAEVRAAPAAEAPLFTSHASRDNGTFYGKRDALGGRFPRLPAASVVDGMMKMARWPRHVWTSVFTYGTIFVLFPLLCFLAYAWVRGSIF